MEYELRGPSAPSKGETADFVSAFPMGCPKFHDEDIVSTWRLVVETQGPANERSSRPAPKSKSWMLEDTPGHVTHKGQQEGALASHYYVVHRDPNGPGFTAVPVGEWVKFKPCFQVDAPQTLEEAESMMSNRNQSASRITRKLAADAVKLEGVVGRPAGAGEEDDEDGTSAPRRVKEEDGEGEGFDFEEVFDNDDVAMAEEEEEGGDEHLKPKGIKSADDPDDGELDESGKGMKKILKKERGESESDSEDEDEGKPAVVATPMSQGDAAEDDAEEEEDLDAMAATMPVRQQMTSGAVRARSSEDEEDEDVPLAKKMKRPTPPPASLVAKVKPEKTPPPPAAAAAAAKAAPGGAGLTKEAVIALLKQCKKLQTADLIKKVKESGLAGLKTAGEKTALSSIVKEVAKMEEHPPGSGKRYIVLRQKFQ